MVFRLNRAAEVAAGGNVDVAAGVAVGVDAGVGVGVDAGIAGVGVDAGVSCARAAWAAAMMSRHRAIAFNFQVVAVALCVVPISIRSLEK